MERFAKVIADHLSKTLEQPVESSELEIPPDSTLGDFAFPCFKLSKKFRKPPPAISKELADSLKETDLQNDFQIEPAGPYLNFRVSSDCLLSTILPDILSGEGLGSYGRVSDQKRGTWVLEFSSPNIAKPFMIYHLRGTAQGAALSRVGELRGFRVIKINHLGDWGTQYGKLVVAFERYGKTLPKEPTIEDMVEIYVEFHKAAEKDPSLEDQAREAFLKLEKGDPEVTRLWKKCVDIALKEFGQIYERIGVQFDHIWGESFYKDKMAPILEELKQKKILVESEGAWVVPVENPKGKELPPCILQKKDGATIYATRDLAAAIYRFDQFHFDRMSYIVGGEQKLHFVQLFQVLKKSGRTWHDRCEHVPTGIYRSQSGKMSTRKGNFVTLEMVLTEAKEKVRELIQNRETSTMDPNERDEISEQIAVGAVIFNDLKTDPSRDVDFDLERVVDFDGETGPYLQYAHTRCVSILRKAAQPFPFSKKAAERLTHPKELLLLKTLGQFPRHLERTLLHSKASQLANYLIDLTKVFNSFYHECKVIQPNEPELTHARLLLVEATRRILGQGLGLLGIPLPKRM